jgi:hypothetical protein
MQVEIPLTRSTAEGTISGQEELINIYPVKSDSKKYGYVLKGSPGLAFFAELPTMPVRALHRLDDRLFAITKSNMYEVFNDGTYKDLGVVDFRNERVVVASNGIQILAVDGRKTFYYDINLDTVGEIVPDGNPPTHVTYQDGYFILNRTGTSQFYISGLLSIDFDPLDFATAEGSPDGLLAVISSHRELFMMGVDTIEVYYNSGNTLFPFDRNSSAFIEKGIAAPYSIAKINNTIYYVGSDLMVYVLAGYTPTRVSNNAVELSLQNVDLSDAFAYSYHDEGNLFYVLTIPAREVTWCLDVSTGAWHKKQDYNFTRHRANCESFVFGKTLVGDFQSGRLFQMSLDHYLDDGEPLVREFTLPVINQGREFLTLNSIELDMSSGVGQVNGQGSDPIARMQFSKDNGKTFSNIKTSRIGKIGEYYTRCKWNRLGRSRQFTVKFQISDPIPIDIGGAWVEGS